MNTRRRQFLHALSILGLAPWVGACARRPDFAIASHVWPGYELMFLARREGWIDGAGRGFRLQETASASQSLEALAAGEVAGAALTLDEVLLARSRRIPLSVVLIFNISNGADVVLGRPGLRDLNDLRGARIGVETGALGAFMLHEVLLAAGIPQSEVEIVAARVDEHPALWADGGVDALITFEPTSSQLERQGAVRLFDSRSMPDTIFDVLAVRPERAAQHRQALRTLLTGHFRALRHLRHNPLDAAYRMADRLGLTGPQVLEIFHRLEMPDLEKNRLYLGADRHRVEAAALKLSRIMVSAGMLDQPDDLRVLTDGRFLPAVVPA